MYTAYFGLAEHPFNLTPDMGYLFLSNYHQQALDHLSYGVNHRKGFMAVFGGVGTGKTTLCRAFLNQLGPKVKSALLFNTVVSEIEFLETVNQEFGLDTRGVKRTKKAQMDLLNRFLLDNFKNGGNAVLIIDEAQNLSPGLLEQIRMISNLETDKDKLIQIVLMGQPELAALLATPGLRQLNERITVRYHLKPLDRWSVKSYIDHRLVLAGNRGTVSFTRGAVNAVFSYSQGNPRRINAVCDRALLIAYCRDDAVISKEVVHRAVDDIQGNVDNGHSRREFFSRRLAPAAAVMVMAFLVVNLGGAGLLDRVSSLWSTAEKVAAVQGRAFIRKPVTFAESVPPLMLPIDMEAPAVPEKKGQLILDKQTGLGKLLTLFDVEAAQGDVESGEIYPNLYTFHGDPAVFRTFERPFLVRVKVPAAEAPGYLLVEEVTQGGAVAIDEEGNRRPVTDDFILTQWDGEISWVYPYAQMGGRLTEGMSGLGVLKIQQGLQALGYSVEPRGVYDSITSEEVTRFQLNFGLRPNGEVGTSTRALMYQMSSAIS